MKTKTGILVLLVATLFACNEEAKETTDKAIKAISALVKIQDAALAALDRETLNSIFDDSGQYTTELGEVLNKEDYITDCFSKADDSMVFKTPDSHDVSIRVFGDTAIQSQTWIGTEKKTESPFGSRNATFPFGLEVGLLG